jgi:hypothetical protein
MHPPQAQDALRVLLLAFSTLFFVAAFADMAARLSPATARTLWCVNELRRQLWWLRLI